MTNTLHRYGGNFDDDYIVFAIPARGINDANAAEKERRFLQIARKYNPVNMGDASHGGIFRPSKELNPSVHWNRRDAKDIETVLNGVSSPTTVAAVFDSADAVVAFVKELKAEDLGLSINISGGLDGARECARRAGLERHSVEYSLGFLGQTDRMAERQTLELSTMCGHGMLSFGLVRKLIEWVKQGRRSPEQAAATMARFCSCGVFNPARACRLMRESNTGPRLRR
jgi:hypothetical protein